MSSLKRVKSIIESIEVIRFKPHFIDRVKERPINQGMVIKLLKDPSNLLKVEGQPARIKEEEKYKLWLKLSNKYCLVLIVTIFKKDLYIVTGWNTNIKWQKKIQK